MSLKQKIKEFNIVGVIVKLLSIPLYLGFFILIVTDPLGLLKKFKNASSIQLGIILLFALIFNLLYKKRKNNDIN